MAGSAVAPLAAQRSAGVIAGVVLHGTSGAALPHATIRLPALARETESDATGAFRFAGVPAGTHTLAVHAIGHVPLARVVAVAGGDTLSLRLELAEAVVALPGLVVTGTLTERRYDETVSPTTVLADAELDRRLDQTLGATLRTTPGVAVTSLGPNTGRPVIRGLGGDRVLILEDGLRTGDLSAQSADHAVVIDPLTARQVEVVRGPMALLYGSNAMGGVVNAVRDEIPRALPDHAHGQLSAQGSTVNTGGALGGDVVTRLGRDLAVRAEATVRGGGDVRTPGGTLTNTQLRSASGSVGAAFVRDWGRAGGAYRYYRNDYGIPGGFIGAHPTGVDIEMERHTLRGELDLVRRVGPLASLKGSAQYVNYRHVELTKAGNIGTSFGQQMAVMDLVGRHAWLGRGTSGAIGVRGQFRDVVTGGALRTPDTREFTGAVFAVQEVGTGPVRAQAGVRYDATRFEPTQAGGIFVDNRFVPIRPRTFGSLSGSVGAVWTARPGVQLGASANRAFRTPDFNEIFSNGPHLASNSFDVGDPDLRQETGVGIDLFARVTTTRFRLDVAAYRNQLTDYIFASSRGRAELGAQGARPRFQFTNGNARFEGMEGFIAWNATRRLVLEATGSWVRAEFTTPNAPVPVITPDDTTFVTASRFPPWIPPLNGQAAARWEADRWFAGVEGRVAARQDRTGDFETPTDGWAIVNLVGGVRFDWGDRVHAITLRVDNVGDRLYRDHLSRVKAIRPEPGRNVSLLYRVQF
ncbi:MAG: TonB-dependent receptor [Gemmatimonadales bacterium]|nr:TonB-dependent receptor [Gemmatimonadales bacterium]